MQFKKEDSLTVKGVAILLMLFYHLFSASYIYEKFTIKHLFPNKEFVQSLAGFGNICVAIFVFLSAYGISVSIQKRKEEKKPKEIYKEAWKRALVLILHFFTMYFSICLVWFVKFDFSSIYGDGKQSIILAIADALGLAELLNTPTLCMTWWYMGLAIVLIFALPLLQYAYEKIGIFLVAVVCLLPVIIKVDIDLYIYMVVAAIGVCASNGNWLVKMKENKVPYLIKAVITIALLVLTIMLRENFVVYTYLEIVSEGFVALVWVAGIYLLFEKIPLLTKCLQFLGKHAINIFFVHTFFYLILYQDVFYGLQYAWLIYIAILGVSLLYSILLEFIKRRLGVYKLVKLIKGGKNG